MQSNGQTGLVGWGLGPLCAISPCAPSSGPQVYSLGGKNLVGEEVGPLVSVGPGSQGRGPPVLCRALTGQSPR